MASTTVKTFVDVSLRWLPLLAIIVVVANYFLFLYQHAVNIPYEDDIFDVLNFVKHVAQSDNFPNTVELFWTSFNGHGTGASRLTYYGVYLLQGEVNFRTLNILANGALAGLLVILYLPLRSHQYKWLLLLPAALILFQLRSYLTITWTMAAFAYFYVLLYGFCSIHLLNNLRPGTFALALVFAILGNFSLASGQLIWLIGLLSLMQQGYIHKKSVGPYIVVWLALAVVALTVFHMAPAAPLSDFALPHNIVGASFLEKNLHRLSFFLLLMGNAVTDSNLYLAGAIGAFSLLALLSVVARSYKEEDIRLQLYCVYLVLTIAAVSFGRAELATIDYALSSRFSFPSILMLCTLWLLFLSRTDRKGSPVLALAAVLAIVLATQFSVDSYCRYSEPAKAELNSRIRRFNRHRFPTIGHPAAVSLKSVQDAIALGVYREPDREHPESSSAIGFFSQEHCSVPEA